MVDSGATSHMTGSKNIVVDLEPSYSTVSYGDNTCSKVLGLGKVVVTPDISLVNVLLVETLGYTPSVPFYNAYYFFAIVSEYKRKAVFFCK